jgi:hypothetical protein
MHPTYEDCSSSWTRSKFGGERLHCRSVYSWPRHWLEVSRPLHGQPHYLRRKSFWCLDPTDGLGDVPVASRYTNCALPALNRNRNKNKIYQIKKSKVFLLTGRGGVYGCEMSRILHCLDNRLIYGEPAALYHQKDLTPISVRGWVNCYCTA